MALILAVSREVERRSSIDGGRLLWTSGDHRECCFLFNGCRRNYTLSINKQQTMARRRQSVCMTVGHRCFKK